MPDFYYKYDGEGRERTRISCDTVEEARNQVVKHLGTYLTEHPGFASEGHWRVDLEDMFGKPVLHVIVATVPANAFPLAG